MILQEIQSIKCIHLLIVCVLQRRNIDSSILRPARTTSKRPNNIVISKFLNLTFTINF